jgi:hypothetical protein
MLRRAVADWRIDEAATHMMLSVNDIDGKNDNAAKRIYW